MRPGGRRSLVWDCFERTGSVTRCLKCDAKFKYWGSTTSMKYHLVNCTASPPRDEKGAVKCLQDERAPLEAPETSTPETDEDPKPRERKRGRRSTVWDVFRRVDNEVHCTLCDTKLKFMSSTTSMMYHIKRNHAAEDVIPPAPPAVVHEDVTKLICRMIEKDLLPLSMVDGDGFRELLSYILCDYIMPSVDDVARWMEDRFRDKVEELRAQLGTVEMVALTAYYWTAAHAERYLTVSCSFVTGDWQARSAVLQTHSISDRHTATEDFTERLLHTVETWGITGKVTACVHNNTQDVSADRGATWDSVICFATTLQLAVNDGMSDDLLSLVVAARKLVKHFNHNSLASKALELKQAQMHLPQHKLVQSSKANWDTVCDMFERLLEQRWAVKAVLSDCMVTSRQESQTLEIEDEYWQIIENFTPVLATLKWAKTVVSAATDTAISNIYPITFSLLQTHLVATEHDVKQVLEFKFKVRESLRKRMEVDSSDIASRPALIATMLDPRHKHLSFLTPTERLAAKGKLQEIVSKIAKITPIVHAKVEKQETPVTPAVSPVAVSPHKGGDTKNTMMLLLGDDYNPSYATDSEAQVIYYLRDMAPSLDINPLDWWRVNGPRFPYLATLARHYLSIPGVSLSTAGETLARMRTSLSPEHADMMIFLNKNMSLA